MKLDERIIFNSAAPTSWLREKHLHRDKFEEAWHPPLKSIGVLQACWQLVAGQSMPLPRPFRAQCRTFLLLVHCGWRGDFQDEGEVILTVSCSVAAVQGLQQESSAVAQEKAGKSTSSTKRLLRAESSPQITGASSGIYDDTI